MTSTLNRQLAGENGAPVDRFVIAKHIRKPEHTALLAEFMGIMLGDGCICSPFQAAVYFNAYTDVEYADFVRRQMEELFEVSPRGFVKEGTGVGCLMMSSRRFVDYLMELGMPKGDKVTAQAGVPHWILKEAEYRRSCLRGLMDTDGSVYRYGHTVYGRRYVHAALCFTNHSVPLLEFVARVLSDEGYRPVVSRRHVFVHRQMQVSRYFHEIGTHNPKFIQRYRSQERYPSG